MDLSRRAVLGWIAACVAAAFTRLHAQDQPSKNQTSPSGSPAPKAPTYQNPYQPIEDAASAMKVGDSESVHAVVEALFEFPGNYRMPEMMAAVVKQRLIDAQMRYLDGKASGVTDGATVDAVNALATAFEAPDYARVSTLQIRFLRNRLAVGMPIFMGSVPEARAEEPNPPMSPLQAMFLMSTIINQKRVNPDYQVPPAEWDRDFYPRLQEQARAADELRRRVAAGQAKYEAKGTLFAITAKPNLETVLIQRIQQMSVTDGLKLFNDTFARLGIN